MSYEPITSLEIENYGCIQKASFTLTRFHALIGPNDSGKSTTLRALRALTQFAAGAFDPAKMLPFDPMIGQRYGTRLRMGYADGLAYELLAGEGFAVREGVYEGTRQVAADGTTRGWNARGLLSSGRSELAVIAERVTLANQIRFDSNALREPSRQILAKDPIAYFDVAGHGLASVYQAINSRDVDAYVSIREGVRKLFPSVQSILVPTVEDNRVVIQARLMDGAVVPAAAMSDGLLYYLGYAALQYLSESRLLLVEEPENGLHPARIAEVMRILREISKTSQVVIATHSPFVVNELEPHEVTVVTRDEEGTHARLIKDTPGFEERSKVYALGELWVSYANGMDEAPLLTGGPRQ